MKTITLFLLMILVISSVSLFAEEKEEKGCKPTGISLGIKFMGVNEKFLISTLNSEYVYKFAYGFDVSIYYQDFFYKLKYDVIEDFDLFSNSPRLEQFGFLCGRKFDFNFLRLQFAIGISRNSQITLGEIIDSDSGWNFFPEYEEFSENSFGMPFEAGVRLIMLWDLAAIGIDIIGNINNLNTVIYPTLTLEMGKLR